MMSIMCVETEARVGAVMEPRPDELARAAPSIRAKVGFCWFTPVAPGTDRPAGCTATLRFLSRRLRAGDRRGCSDLPRTRESLAARTPRMNDAG
jgi:hypothetical protein